MCSAVETAADLASSAETVMKAQRDFDLVLSYPQWQGSARHENLLRGALAAAEVCAEYGPLAQVPLAGEGLAGEGIRRWTAILEQFRSAQRLLRQAGPKRLLTAGGDCSVDVAVIDYLHRLYPDLTVIWVDAHLDANTAETSPSGSFHGMPVAAIMGEAPAEMLRDLGPSLPPTRFRYVSAQVGDDGEWRFQRGRGLEWLGPDEVIGGPVHIHFDLDALDPAEFPYVAYKDGVLPLAAGVELVRRFAAAGKLVGLTLTEFAPADDDEAANGVRVLAELCRAAASRDP